MLAPRRNQGGLGEIWTVPPERAARRAPTTRNIPPYPPAHGIRSRGHAAPAEGRDPRCTRRRRAVPACPHRRRDDHSRQAPVEARSRTRSTGWQDASRAARCSSPRRTGRRRRPRWWPRSSAPTCALAHNRAGRESRLRRRLCAARRETAPSWGSSRWTRPRFPRLPAGSARARSASSTSSATSSTATESLKSSQSAGARLSGLSIRCVRHRQRRRPAAGRPRLRARARCRLRARRRPRWARPGLQHAADSKYCIRCGTPYVFAAAYVGHLGRLPLPELWPCASRARRRCSQCRAVGARKRVVRLWPRRRARRASAFASRASTTSTTPSRPRH